MPSSKLAGNFSTSYHLPMYAVKFILGTGVNVGHAPKWITGHEKQKAPPTHTRKISTVCISFSFVSGSVWDVLLCMALKFKILNCLLKWYQRPNSMKALPVFQIFALIFTAMTAFWNSLYSVKKAYGVCSFKQANSSKRYQQKKLSYTYKYSEYSQTKSK